MAYPDLGIIDLDDVVCYPGWRRNRAERAKTAYLQQNIAVSDPEEAKRVVKRAESEFFRVLFTPEFVERDTLIPETLEHLRTLEKAGFHLLFLTSRPESMREVTLEWLFAHGIEFAPCDLVMCAPAFREGYTKTVVLKTGLIQTFARMFSVSRLLVIDDKEENRDAMEAGKSGLPANCGLTVCSRLAEAVIYCER